MIQVYEGNATDPSNEAAKFEATMESMLRSEFWATAMAHYMQKRPSTLDQVRWAIKGYCEKWGLKPPP